MRTGSRLLSTVAALGLVLPGCASAMNLTGAGLGSSPGSNPKKLTPYGGATIDVEGAGVGLLAGVVSPLAIFVSPAVALVCFCGLPTAALCLADLVPSLVVDTVTLPLCLEGRAIATAPAPKPAVSSPAPAPAARPTVASEGQAHEEGSSAPRVGTGAGTVPEEWPEELQGPGPLAAEDPCIDRPQRPGDVELLPSWLPAEAHQLDADEKPLPAHILWQRTWLEGDHVRGTSLYSGGNPDDVG